MLAFIPTVPKSVTRIRIRVLVRAIEDTQLLKVGFEKLCAGGRYQGFSETSKPASLAWNANFSYSFLSCQSTRIFQPMTVSRPISRTTPIAEPTATEKKIYISSLWLFQIHPRGGYLRERHDDWILVIFNVEMAITDLKNIWLSLHYHFREHKICKCFVNNLYLIR